MQHRNQNTNYPYIPTSDPMTSLNPMSSLNSMSTPKPNYQYNTTQRSVEPSFYSNTTMIPTYTSECFQRMYQAPTTLSDLTDPGWTYDDLGPPANFQSNISTVTAGYVPTNGVKRSTVSDTRLATASTMREQLLTDILRDIGDINEEISSMEGQLSRSRQMPFGFSPAISNDMPDRDRDRDLEQSRYIPGPELSNKDLTINSTWN